MLWRERGPETVGFNIRAEAVDVGGLGADRDAAVLFGDGIPDVVMLPADLGGRAAKVTSVERWGTCPCGGDHEVIALILAGAGAHGSPVAVACCVATSRFMFLGEAPRPGGPGAPLRGTVYRVDGTYELIEIDRANALKPLQAQVGGYIERVGFSGGVMYVDEDGVVIGRIINRTASRMAGIPIHGDVVVFSGGEDIP